MRVCQQIRVSLAYEVLRLFTRRKFSYVVPALQHVNVIGLSHGGHLQVEGSGPRERGGAVRILPDPNFMRP